MSLAAEAWEVLSAGMPLEWCLAAPCGAFALGTAGADETLDITAIWIAPTAELLRIDPPATTWERQGHLHGVDVVLSGYELGDALRRLRDGESPLLEAVFSHHNLATSETHEHLVERVRDGLHRGYVDHVIQRVQAHRRNKSVDARRTAAALLLLAIHLANTGVVNTDALALASSQGRQELLTGTPTDAELDALTSDLRRGAAAPLLPRALPHPQAFDEFLLFVREARW